MVKDSKEEEAPQEEPTKLVLHTYCFSCHCFRDHLIKHGRLYISFECESCHKVNSAMDRLSRLRSRRAILRHARTIYIHQKMLDLTGNMHYEVSIEAVTGSGIGGLCIATMEDASATICVQKTLLDGQIIWEEYKGAA